MPKEWQKVKLGDIFKNRREKGRANLPVMSVTMDNGLVERTSLARKTDTALTADQHLLVEKGDIAYNMMRMWQGASGLASHDGIVSPAYVVLAPKKGIDPLFASYWFKSARMIYLFWAYSYGITGDRLRLYYKDFAKIPTLVPTYNEQLKIGQALEYVDKASLQIQKLIQSKLKLKKSLAQKLCTASQRLPGFTRPWNEITLSNLVYIIFSNVDKKCNANERSVHLCNYTDVYYNEKIERGMALMKATATESEIKKFSLKKWDVIITKDSESPGDIAKPAVVTEDMPDVVCGYHLAILRPKTIAHGPYLAQLLRLPRVRYEVYRIANGVTRFGLNQNSLAGLRLTVPEVCEQRQIASVLSHADDEMAILEREVLVLGELKKALQQKLMPSNILKSG